LLLRALSHHICDCESVVYHADLGSHRHSQLGGSLALPNPHTLAWLGGSLALPIPHTLAWLGGSLALPESVHSVPAPIRLTSSSPGSPNEYSTPLYFLGKNVS
jgi:hypothetical protein